MYASRQERGVVAVEFALIVPLLMLFLFAIVEGGTRYAQQTQVNHWAFLAARDLSINPTDSASAYVATLKGADSHTFVTAVSPSSGRCPGTTGSQVTVTVTSTRTSVSGMFGSYTIKGTSVARCENG